MSKIGGKKKSSPSNALNEAEGTDRGKYLQFHPAFSGLKVPVFLQNTNTEYHTGGQKVELELEI